MALPSIYLAGPEVFWPDAREIGRAKQKLCAEYGFEGLFPLDGVADGAAEIYRANVAMIRKAALLIANITPFRGSGADPGTAFEIGYMAALGRPVLAYSHVAAPYKARVQAQYGLSAEAGFDPDGLLIEDFDLADNLMLDRAVAEAGGQVVRLDVPVAERFSSLAGFERCLGLARALPSCRHAPLP